MDDFGPGQTEFPSICGPCGLPIIRTTEGHGKRKVTRESCGCTRAEPEAKPKPRSVKNTSAKGKRLETALCKSIAQIDGVDAFKTAGSGAHGSRNNETSQDTDVILRFKNRDGAEVERLKVECKLFASIPGFKSMEGLRSRSDMLLVRQDHGEGRWWVPDPIMQRMFALMAEALK